jgi:hypothetical protein
VTGPVARPCRQARRPAGPDSPRVHLRSSSSHCERGLVRRNTICRVERPRFGWRTFISRVVVGTVAASGFTAWLATTPHFWTKVEIIAAVAAGVAVLSALPFLLETVSYARIAIRAMPDLPERLRRERASIWLAVEANALLNGVDVRMLRLRLDGSEVAVLLNIGSGQRVREGMLFEVVALPDFEVYGLVRVDTLDEETAWCGMVPDQGHGQFIAQMRQRLQAGDVAPPQGYLVRPFMADTYNHLQKIMVERRDPTQFQATVPFDEERHA